MAWACATRRIRSWHEPWRSAARIHRRRRLLAALFGLALLGVGVMQARRHRPGDVRCAGGLLKRPADKRGERFTAADRKVHARAWTDAVRVLARDPGAHVQCPVCAAGSVTADWLAFASGTGGEWVAQCVECGAWHSEARARRDRGS